MPQPYKVILTDEALERIQGLPLDVGNSVFEHLEQISEDPDNLLRRAPTPPFPPYHLVHSYWFYNEQTEYHVDIVCQREDVGVVTVWGVGVVQRSR